MQDLFGKVCFFALNFVRSELNKAWKNAGDQKEDSSTCSCATKINYGLPCQHMIVELGFVVKLNDIPGR